MLQFLQNIRQNISDMMKENVSNCNKYNFNKYILTPIKNVKNKNKKIRTVFYFYLFIKV